MSTSKIKRAFEQACNRVGITYGRGLAASPGMGLRRTFATRLPAAGVHAFDIKELMGHKTLSVIVDYTHASPEAMRRP